MGPRTHGSDHARLARQVKKEEPVCALCGLPGFPNDPLEAGHIIPRVLGGPTVRENYRAEHRSHNRAAGSRVRKLVPKRYP